MTEAVGNAVSSLIRPRSWFGAARTTGRLVALHVRWLGLALYWRAYAWFRGSRMPPGALIPGDGIRKDQRRVLDAAQVHGPVLKLVSDNSLSTCVVGLGRGRRLLTEHEESMRGLTIDLTSLFPLGALRGMEGEDRKLYRRRLLQALQSVTYDTQAANVDAAISQALHSCASQTGGMQGPEIRAELRAATGRIMMGVLYGIDPSQAEYHRMQAAFRRFGPNEPVYELQAENSRAFSELLGEVRALADGIRRDPESARPSMLRHLVVREELDDAALGNMVNLFEPSHFDVYCLWHWIMWYLAREPELLARMRSLRPGSQESQALAEAIALETLRSNQSETLLRVAKRDILFDGFMIPRDTRVRVCLWESHKDPEIFPDPFRFDPDRFIGRSYGIDEFAPFGLDRKRCIAADLVIAISARFAELMARGFDWEIMNDGPPVRSVYHWQPSPSFALRATQRPET